MDGYALIVPEPGQEKETLRFLLVLAVKPRHVKLNTDDPGTSFYVPEYLAEKYHSADDESPADTEDEKPAPKRRGRPPGRKAAEAADVKDGED